MINIAPLAVDNKELFRNIVKHKHNPHRQELENIDSYIYEDYSKYEDHRNNLEVMNPDIRVKDDADDLILCYKSGSDSEEVRKRIMDNLPNPIKATCPYCMISEPNTFDHYLDKSEFPEFSIYTDNLIPCCGICNDLKHNKWRKNGRRLFVNVYFDSLIIDDYLFIDVDCVDSVPTIVCVRLDFSNVNASEYDISLVKNHYDKLHLINRYKEQAVTALQNTIQEYTCFEKESSDEIRKQLCRKIVSLERSYGHNYWESAMYKGMLASDRTLEYLSY